MGWKLHLELKFSNQAIFLRLMIREFLAAGMIRIEDHCFIGADVTILPYRTIGRGAVVAAGSIVTRVSYIPPSSKFFAPRCAQENSEDSKLTLIPLPGRSSQYCRRRKSCETHS